MKITLFIISFLMIISCWEKNDKFLGCWYINRTDLINNKICISKANENYIVEINNLKLSGIRDKSMMKIDNKGQEIKAVLTDKDELIIDGETATRTNPIQKSGQSVFDQKATDQPTTQNTLSVNPTEGFGNATIIGHNVIFRENHSTTARVLGNFSNNEKVLVIDEYRPINLNEAITAKPVRLYNAAGNSLYTLPKGKAVQIISTSDGYYEVSFKHTQYGVLYAKIYSDDLEIISGDKWYKVKRSNGKSGWVFSKFLNYVQS